MKPNDFDNLAQRAIRRLEEPSEQVWLRSRPKPKPIWLPTWNEIGLAAAVGAMTLVCLALVGERVTPPDRQDPIIVQHKTPSRGDFETSFLAVNRLAGVRPSTMVAMDK